MASSIDNSTMSTMSTTVAAASAVASLSTAADSAAMSLADRLRLKAGSKKPSGASTDDHRSAERTERYKRYDILSRQLASLILTKLVGAEEAHYLQRQVDAWLEAGSPAPGPAIARDFDPHPKAAISVAATKFGWTNAFNYRPPGSKDGAPPEDKYWAGFTNVCPIPDAILDIDDRDKRDAAVLDFVAENDGHAVVAGHVIRVIEPSAANKGVPIMTFTRGTLPPDGFRGTWDGLKNLRDNGVAPLIDLLSRYLAPLEIAVFDQFYGAEAGNVIEAVWDHPAYDAKILAIKKRLASRAPRPPTSGTGTRTHKPTHTPGPAFSTTGSRK